MLRFHFCLVFLAVVNFPMALKRYEQYMCAETNPQKKQIIPMVRENDTAMSLGTL